MVVEILGSSGGLFELFQSVMKSLKQTVVELIRFLSVENVRKEVFLHFSDLR